MFPIPSNGIVSTMRCCRVGSGDMTFETSIPTTKSSDVTKHEEKKNRKWDFPAIKRANFGSFETRWRTHRLLAASAKPSEMNFISDQRYPTVAHATISAGPKAATNRAKTSHSP
jgi:hypothetical protein